MLQYAKQVICGTSYTHDNTSHPPHEIHGIHEKKY